MSDNGGSRHEKIGCRRHRTGRASRAASNRRRHARGEEGDVAVNGAFGSGTTTVVGWTAGIGIEAMFTRSWSGKAEYLYMDFGNRAIFNDTVGGATFPESLRFIANVLRVGLNYRFGQ